MPDTERPAQNARFIVRVLGTTVVALALHLTLGWAWTVAAGMIGGVTHPRRGGLVGLFGGGLDWAALVGYNYIVAGAATEMMTRTVGGMLGNTPEVLVVAATVFIGALLGGLGGTVGMLARRLARDEPPSRQLDLHSPRNPLLQ